MSKSKRSPEKTKLPKSKAKPERERPGAEPNRIVQAEAIDPLESWLPKNPFDFSRVFEPVLIDPAIAHLAKYHPQDAKERVCSFRLVRNDTEPDKASIDVFDLSNWDSQFVEILRLLRFRVVNFQTHDEHLLDDSIRDKQVQMASWKVVRWTIRRSEFDANSQPTKLTDRIEWVRVDGTGAPAYSTYSWLPYKPG